MLKITNEYGMVKIGSLYTQRNLPKTQSITRRQASYPFTQFTRYIQDFDILRASYLYNNSFFDLPYYEREVYVEESHRPDLISYAIYGDTDFWSFIMLFNKLADPFIDLYQGRKLNIPFADDLYSWLTKALVQFPSNNVTQPS